ncbi:hypothetical protein E2562_032963 [Oryza meyeriana var. granulata]|uniref:Uncharacterized protein n=1 Tax=Oryza meyeriana var. granulata TaxID=110450 RepID=A0A6G1D9Z7_9ORYZ|nr:hypothetical protein E2562_032963 [Oryza meyeriana var. granulata]
MAVARKVRSWIRVGVEGGWVRVEDEWFFGLRRDSSVAGATSAEEDGVGSCHRKQGRQRGTERLAEKRRKSAVRVEEGMDAFCGRNFDNPDQERYRKYKPCQRRRGVTGGRGIGRGTGASAVVLGLSHGNT